MPAATHEANANAHPGYVVLNAQQTRCTTKEVEDAKAKAKAKAKAIAAKQEAAIKHHAVLARIATLKANVEREEKAI